MKKISRLNGISSAQADLEAKLEEFDELEYGQQRQQIAERYEIRLKTLDAIRSIPPKRNASPTREFKLPEIEPWPEPVDGLDMLDGLYEAICTYIVIDKAPLAAVVLWIVHAHAHDAAPISPILLITAATKGCGKSTLLDVLASLVPRPLLSAATTSAALFRSAPAIPTILCDEGDTYLGQERRLVTFFNAGHRRGAPFRLCEGENNEPKEHPSWCPKVIAQIGLPHEPTIVERSILVELRRKKPGEPCEDFSTLEPHPRLDELGRKCARWAQDHAEELRASRPALPPGFANRRADNWKPLLAIAEAAGGCWPERARRAAETIGEAEDDDLTIMLLTDLRELFERSEEFFTDELVTRLNDLNDRPWASLRHGRGIDGNWLARTLRGFKIWPERIQKSVTRKRGYHRAQFTDAWARYLPPGPEDGGGDGSSSPSVPSTPSSDSPTVTDNLDGTDTPAEDESLLDLEGEF